MANLYTGTIPLEGYQTITSLTGVAFTEGTTYTFQVFDTVYIREGTTGYGFKVLPDEKFQWIATDNDLYIGKYNNTNTTIINISD